MTNAMDFIDPANRLAVLEQVTAEGMLSLKKDTVRGNEYHGLDIAENHWSCPHHGYHDDC